MDLRKERTLKNLSDSLFGLMREKRYGDITVAEICENAMVRRATFYRHFSGKDDLLRFVIRNARRQIRLEVDPDDNLSLQDFCAKMTEALLCFIEDHQILLRKASSASDLSLISTLVAQEISSEFEKRLEKEALDTSGAEIIKDKGLLADFYTFGLVGAIVQVFEQGKEFDKDKILFSLQGIFDRLFAVS